MQYTKVSTKVGHVYQTNIHYGNLVTSKLDSTIMIYEPEELNLR